jgi:hypothetical protein
LVQFAAQMRQLLPLALQPPAAAAAAGQEGNSPAPSVYVDVLEPNMCAFEGAVIFAWKALRHPPVALSLAVAGYNTEPMLTALEEAMPVLQQCTAGKLHWI